MVREHAGNNQPTLISESCNMCCMPHYIYIHSKQITVGCPGENKDLYTNMLVIYLLISIYYFEHVARFKERCRVLSPIVECYNSHNFFLYFVN